MKRNFRSHKHLKGLTALVAFTVALGMATATAQAAPVLLGTTHSFAVLGGSAVTNTGPSVISGNLGVSPANSVTGFPPGLVIGGTIHTANGVATQAQADLVIAYDDAAGRPSNETLAGDPTGRTLSPGVYTSASSIDIAGDLTLDGGGDPNAVFVFQAGSSLLGGPGSRILLQNGANACNVFWQVGSSATINPGSAFAGNILALTSISMETGATLEGRALARNGAVTLDTNTITKADCAPYVGDVSASTTQDSATTVVLDGSDSSGATVTYTITDQPDNGTLGPIDQATGAVTYTPDAGYTGPDSFTYDVTSINGTSSTATGSITVTEPPRAGNPVAIPVTTATGTGTPVTSTPTAAKKKKTKKKEKLRRKKTRRPPAFTG